MQFQKNEFQFLKDLENNNNREWFTENKPTFIAIQNQIKQVFTEKWRK